MQPQFTLLQKTMLITGKRTTRQINPDINMWELSRPLIEKLMTLTIHSKFWRNGFTKINMYKIPEIIDKIDEILSKKMK